MPKKTGDNHEVQEQQSGFEKLSPEEQQQKLQYDALFEDQTRFDKLSYEEKVNLFRNYLILTAKMDESYDADKEQAMMEEINASKDFLDKAFKLLIDNIKTGTIFLRVLTEEYIPELAYGKSIRGTEVNKEELLGEFEQYKIAELREDDVILQRNAAKNAPQGVPEEKVEEKINDEVKQEKAPRPWDTVEDKKNIEYLYGPEKANDGTTREEFFDRMKAQGWNRDGDEDIIAAMYVRCSEYLQKVGPENPNILKDLMTQSATTYMERKAVAEMALKASPTFDTSDHQKTMTNRLKAVVDQAGFLTQMREKNGWNREGDEKIIAIMAKVPDKFCGKDGSRHLRSILLEKDGSSLYGRRDAISTLREESKNSLKDQDIEILDREEKRINDQIETIKKAEVLKKNSVLRSYFNRIIELGLDQFDPVYNDGRDWAVEGRFDNVELDDPHMLDDINAKIDKMQINEKLLADHNYVKLKEELKGPFSEIVKSRFGTEEEAYVYDLDTMFYEDFAERAKTVDEVKKFLKDSLNYAVIDLKKTRLIEEDKEKNPALYQRQSKIDGAVKKVSNILRTLKANINQKFLEDAREKKDTSSIPVEYSTHFGMVINVENDSEAEQNEMFSILDKIADLKKDKQYTDLNDLKNTGNLDDPFWDSYSRALTDKEIGDLKTKFTTLSEAGLDWFEYVDTGAFEKFLKANNIVIGGNFDPYEIAKKACDGPLAEETLKSTCSVPNYQQTMKCLDLIGAEFEKKKEAIADMDVETVSGWFSQNGYNMMENSILAVNGFEEKVIDGQVRKVINLGNGIDVEKLDRDRLNLEQYQRLVDSAKEAQKLYQENERSFQYVFNTMNTKKESSNFGGALMYVGSNIRNINNDPELLNKLNRFRHLLYRIRQADQDVCKLVDVNEKTKEKTEITVEPLPENVQFDDQMLSREVDILKVCYNMVHEPSTRVKRNSGEYESVMSSILNAQKVLKKKYDSNEEARKAYVKAVNKVLNNINRYRLHKANDGVKQDATHDKLIALERVDKLLRTRFQALEQREYEDAIGAVPELFKVDVEPDKLGDQYLLDKALGKIRNMHKQIEDYRKEIDEEQKTIKRSNSIGGILHHNILDEEPAEKKQNAEKPVKEEKKQEARKSPEEKIGFEKIDQKDVAGKGAKTVEDLLDSGSIKKMLDGNIQKSLNENPLMIAAAGRETEYRKTLDLNDENDKTRLFSSAEKSLYMEVLLKGCVEKGETAGSKEAVDTFEKGMKALNKSAIKARAFMAEHLSDKDFNKEFRDRVLAGASAQKISHNDIKQYRDEALKACYTKYKGKDVKAMDNLSKLLGSKVNSKSLQKKQAPKAMVKK